MKDRVFYCRERNYLKLHELYLLIHRCQNGCFVWMLRNGWCLVCDCYEMLDIFVIVAWFGRVKRSVKCVQRSNVVLIGELTDIQRYKMREAVNTDLPSGGHELDNFTFVERKKVARDRTGTSKFYSTSSIHFLHFSFTNFRKMLDIQ